MKNTHTHTQLLIHRIYKENSDSEMFYFSLDFDKDVRLDIIRVE